MSILAFLVSKLSLSTCTENTTSYTEHNIIQSVKWVGYGLKGRGLKGSFSSPTLQTHLWHPLIPCAMGIRSSVSGGKAVGSWRQLFTCILGH